MKQFSILTWIIILTGILAGSCTRNASQRAWIVTETKGQPGSSTDTAWIWNNESRIVLVEDGKTKVLTGNFYSARSPQVSFDGKNMLFAAREKISGPWQIWEMDLAKQNSRKVLDIPYNCTDPAYLPGGKFIFSRTPEKDTAGAAIALFNATLDGKECRQVTFHPHHDLASAVMPDGRILMLSIPVYPVAGRPEFYVMRPDGTKAMEYAIEPGISARPCITSDGRIYYAVSDTGLVSLRKNRPLHSRRIESSGFHGEFRSMAADGSGKLIISYRPTRDQKFALYLFDPATGLSAKPFFSETDYHVVEAVYAGAHAIPKKLPSEVDVEVKTGLLLCQDINYESQSNVARGNAVKAEILGIGASYGVVDVDSDGSFYLKVMANVPFRIRTLDDKGNPVHPAGPWYWLRPNERRGLTGLGQVNEMAPVNRVPLAVKKAPVIIPVHITKINEKDIELE
jgi:hypothetical protein